MSGVLTGAPPSHRLLNLHNQVCCFPPCFQLSCTEGNLLALILESLEITLHDESSEWFSWMLFNKLLNLHCHCNKSRCPMQLVENTVLTTMGGNQVGMSVSEENFKNLTQSMQKIGMVILWLFFLEGRSHGFIVMKQWFSFFFYSWFLPGFNGDKRSRKKIHHMKVLWSNKITLTKGSYAGVLH